MLEWRRRHPESREAAAAYSKAWRAANPEKIRAQWKRQQARRAEKATGPRRRNTKTPCVRCGATDRYASGSCKPCARTIERARKEANPEHVLRLARERVKRYRDRMSPEEKRKRNRAASLRANYAITVEQHDAMLAAQGGVCAICGDAPDHRRLHVDHDHTTGVVRALLCGQCNTAIGGFGENIAVMRRAIAYLESHAALGMA